MAEFDGDFGFSTSHTTRAPRAGETEGVDYHFTTRDDMEQAVAGGEFLEHARVHANMYGTSKKAVHDVTDACRICILDIDVQGVEQLITQHKDLHAEYVEEKTRRREVCCAIVVLVQDQYRTV